MPKNTIRIFFGSHGTEEDAGAIREQFEWCQVFVPELMGWTFATWAQYRAVALGDVETDLAFRALGFSPDSFQRAELQMIEGAGRRVEFLDVPQEHTLWPATQKADQDIRRIAYLDCDWYELLRILAEQAGEFVALTVQREAFILDRLVELDRKLSDTRILVRLGLGHVAFARTAAQRIPGVASVFQRLQFPLMPDGLIFMYLLAGRHVPSRVYAHLVLMRLLIRFGSPLWSDMSLVNLFRTFTRIQQHFTEADVAHLWRQVRADNAQAPTLVSEAFRARGFTSGISQ